MPTAAGSLHDPRRFFVSGSGLGSGRRLGRMNAQAAVAAEPAVLTRFGGNAPAESPSFRPREPRCDVMKLIIAIIQPDKLEAVKKALTEVEVVRLTVMDCQGFGRQKGQTGVYRGHTFGVHLLRKIQLQIAVNEDFVNPTVEAILRGGRSGEEGRIGDGKIFVLPMDDCIRIRTGERGSEAI